ncbi:MAG: glycosyltransferase involved in cell wall biosynthesis [Flavobacteriales bacterium]|jgi:glycosyltransferase involved in cell wall biosynthesis
MVRKSDDIVESNSSIKIGLLGGNFNQVTIDTIAKIAITEQMGISICIYGSNHNEFNYPDNVKVEFFKSVKFLEYFTTVERMNLDFMVLLGFNPNSEQDKAIFQYGELALLSIPILCDSQNQARRFIKPDVNGFVVTEKNTLEAQIQKLLKDRSIARKAGTAAQGMALKHLSWNPERASQLINIYK